MSIQTLVEKIKEKGNPTVAGLDARLEYIPQHISGRNMMLHGETLRAAAESIYKKLGVWQGKANTMADDAVENFRANDITFKNAVSARFVSALSYIFAFLIAYLLLNIVFAVIINLCNVIFKLPGLKMLNGIGGAVLGLAVGLLIVFAIAWAARYLSFLLGDFVGKTKVLKFFAENNPFNTWLSI